jgi:hypothetical protein
VPQLYSNQPVFSDNVLDLYDAVQSQGGFRFEHAYFSDGRPIGGTVTGYISNLPGPNNSTPGQKRATVIISPIKTYGNVNSWTVKNAPIAYAITAIGELTHLAGQNGTYSDRMLAQAASVVSNIGGLPDNEDVFANSHYYHFDVINNVCYPK